MPYICPKTINLWAAPRGAYPGGGGSPNVLNLTSDSKTANIEQITIYSPCPVNIKYLECKNVRPKACAVHKNTNNPTDIICNLIDKEFAHFYCKEDIAGAKIDGYFIVFIPGTQLLDYDSTVAVLKNTVNFMKIEKGRIYFEIFYYGAPNPNNLSTTAGRFYNQKLREALPQLNYKNGETICRLSYVARGAKILLFTGTDPLKIKAG